MLFNDKKKLCLTKKLSAMKKIVLVIISFLMFGVFYVPAQSVTNIREKVIELQKQKMQQKKQEQLSTTNQPNEKIKVTREYDENGNLIRYDSTYSYFYSSNGEISNGEIKSAEEAIKYFEEFKSKINEQFNISNLSFFNNFFNDTDIFYSKFFDDVYFENLKKEHNKFIESQLELINKLLNENISDNNNASSKDKTSIKGKVY